MASDHEVKRSWLLVTEIWMKRKRPAPQGPSGYAFLKRRRFSLWLILSSER